MKLSLWTNYFVDRDQQQGQQIRARIERPYGREPVVGEVMHFIGAALEVTSVGWLEDGCLLGLEDAIGETTASYLHEAGFR